MPSQRRPAPRATCACPATHITVSSRQGAELRSVSAVHMTRCAGQCARPAPALHSRRARGMAGRGPAFHPLIHGVPPASVPTQLRLRKHTRPVPIPASAPWATGSGPPPSWVAASCGRALTALLRRTCCPGRWPPLPSRAQAASPGRPPRPPRHGPPPAPQTQHDGTCQRAATWRPMAPRRACKCVGTDACSTWRWTPKSVVHKPRGMLIVEQKECIMVDGSGHGISARTPQPQPHLATAGRRDGAATAVAAERCAAGMAQAWGLMDAIDMSDRRRLGWVKAFLSDASERGKGGRRWERWWCGGQSIKGRRLRLAVMDRCLLQGDEGGMRPACRSMMGCRG